MDEYVSMESQDFRCQKRSVVLAHIATVAMMLEGMDNLQLLKRRKRGHSREQLASPFGSRDSRESCKDRQSAKMQNDPGVKLYC